MIDNGDRVLDSDFSEISIVRKLSRDGEGEPAERRSLPARGHRRGAVRLGARQGDALGRLAGQGRGDRPVPAAGGALIEEAAGLGKHRKRRRRAQLKLERTERTSPGRWTGARGALASATAQAPGGGRGAASADRAPVARGTAPAGGGRRPRRACRAERGRGPLHRHSERDEAERLLAEVARRREAAEEAFAAQSRLRGSSRAACLPLARRPSGSASGSSERATRRIPPPSAASVAARSSRFWRSSSLRRPSLRPRRPSRAGGRARRTGAAA